MQGLCCCQANWKTGKDMALDASTPCFPNKWYIWLFRTSGCDEAGWGRVREAGNGQVCLLWECEQQLAVEGWVWQSRRWWREGGRWHVEAGCLELVKLWACLPFIWSGSPWITPVMTGVHYGQKVEMFFLVRWLLCRSWLARSTEEFIWALSSHILQFRYSRDHNSCVFTRNVKKAVLIFAFSCRGGCKDIFSLSMVSSTPGARCPSYATVR